MPASSDEVQLPAYDTAFLIGNVSFPKADTSTWPASCGQSHWQTFGVHPRQILASIKVYNPIRTKLILRSTLWIGSGVEPC